MTFPAPTFPTDHPDRNLECQEVFDLALMKLVDGAVTVGWRASECFDAVEEVIRNQRLAYDNVDTEDAAGELDPQPHVGRIGTPAA